MGIVNGSIGKMQPVDRHQSRDLAGWATPANPRAHIALQQALASKAAPYCGHIPPPFLHNRVGEMRHVRGSATIR
jgi:hypothetical protein